MTLIELKLQQGNDGLAILNPIDIEGLDIENGTLLEISDETLSYSVILKAYISDNAPQNVLVADPNILENLGFQDSDLIELEIYQGNIKFAEQLLVEFSVTDRDPKDFFTSENKRKILQFLQNYYFHGVTEIFWPEQNSLLRVQIQKPKTEVGYVFKVNPESINIKLRQEIQSMPFNAILLIDKSRSMTNRDVKLKGSENVLKDLWERFFESKEINLKNTPYRNLYKWFVALKKYGLGNGLDEDSRRSGRLDSVLLSTILFFQLKISRGFGEKCAFILYSDEAKIIRFNNKNYIEATEFSAEICDKLIGKIKSSDILNYGNTNISSAILNCKEIALEYEKINKNPLMILLLTDGSPYPPEIDNAGRVKESIERLQDFLDARNIPFVLYTLGIGDRRDKNEKLLEAVARKGNGEYHYVGNIKNLIEWYQKLAKEFTVTISNENR
ncbi:MAG: hypothetical protein ACTSR3_12705 [Candidatus Helarchaeota archaeon]